MYGGKKTCILEIPSLPKTCVWNESIASDAQFPWNRLVKEKKLWKGTNFTLLNLLNLNPSPHLSNGGEPKRQNFM